MTDPDVTTQDTHPVVTTHPLLGVIGMLLGALIATFAVQLSDSSILLATCCVACLVVVAFMSAVPTQYRQVAAAPVDGK
jgi:xanthosine utilization system XapX-like protein